MLLTNGCGSIVGKRVNAHLTTPVEKGSPVAFKGRQPSIRYQQTNYLSYQELVQLSKNPDGTPEIQRKLDKFWRTPVVSNEAWFSGVRPKEISTEHLGSMLRVASWNIEKSLTIKEVARALTSESAYMAMINSLKAPEGSTRRAEMLRQRERMMTADVIFLQEMDIGVSRSDYIDAARTLAQALKMNYAYAPQALEVDPVMLGLEESSILGAQKKRIDRARYKGAFGSAILSRYPILHAECFQLKTWPYDWYHGELQSADFVEKSRRLGSKVVFENEISRELKIGGRCFFRVDIAVPQVKGGVVTLVNNHLEIKTRPKNRKEQMDEILSYIKDVKNPIIMAGDHNSAPDDLSATSALRVIWRQLDDPTNFVTTVSNVSSLLSGTVVPVWRERGIVNALKNFQSPMAPDIKYIFPNHTRGMFESVKNYEFADGSTFDFRGDRDKSINAKKGLLANSNEKAFKGYFTSFSVNRPIGPFGRYRLDWFFVRSGLLHESTDSSAPYQFAPHFGETLGEFNDYVTVKFSDHRPIVIDLPFDEPNRTHAQ